MQRISHLLGKTALRGATLLAALALLALSAGAAWADDAVLLASTVPGYVPGMVVSASDRLSLPDGATATLLFQSGEMLRLRGPFEGALGLPPSAKGSSTAALLADMFRMHGVDATVIGGTRSASLGRTGPMLDDVMVDPQRSGTYCMETATSVWITRPADGPGTYALRRKGSNRTLGWPAGAARIEWPADVPIEDGTQFEIVADGTARATVTFRAMPATATSTAGRVANGLLLGCHDQFDDQLRRVSRSAVGPEVWITTDRGRRPSYHRGEPVALTVMADMDGYLYCVAAGDDGSATPIFPAGAVDGALLHGAVPLSIPGGRQPAGLTASANLQHIRCWLADRDITPELPHALLGKPGGRLPDQLASDLDGMFAHIRGTRIESDALNLKLE